VLTREKKETSLPAIERGGGGWVVRTKKTMRRAGPLLPRSCACRKRDSQQHSSSENRYMFRKKGQLGKRDGGEHRVCVHSRVGRRRRRRSRSSAHVDETPGEKGKGGSSSFPLTELNRLARRKVAKGGFLAGRGGKRTRWGFSRVNPGGKVNPRPRGKGEDAPSPSEKKKKKTIQKKGQKMCLFYQGKRGRLFHLPTKASKRKKKREVTLLSW